MDSTAKPSGGNLKQPAAGSDRHWLRPVGIWIVAVTLASLTLATVAALLIWDAIPQAFPARAHLLLGSAPLSLIAVSFLIYQAAMRPRPLEIVKAVVLSMAFLSWAANQLLPDSAHAMLLNDLAIALFVLDVFLAIIGWPPSITRQWFPQSRLLSGIDPPSGSNNGAAESHSTIASVESRR